jgi:hypothetical protein
MAERRPLARTGDEARARTGFANRGRSADSATRRAPRSTSDRDLESHGVVWAGSGPLPDAVLALRAGPTSFRASAGTVRRSRRSLGRLTVAGTAAIRPRRPPRSSAPSRPRRTRSEMAGAQPAFRAALGGPREVRVGMLLRLDAKPARIVRSGWRAGSGGATRSRRPNGRAPGGLIIGTSRSMAGRGAWRASSGAARDAPPSKLWDHDGALTVDPARGRRARSSSSRRSGACESRRTRRSHTRRAWRRSSERHGAGDGRAGRSCPHPSMSPTTCSSSPAHRRGDDGRVHQEPPRGGSADHQPRPSHDGDATPGAQNRRVARGERPAGIAVGVGLDDRRLPVGSPALGRPLAMSAPRPVRMGHRARHIPFLANRDHGS